MPKLSSPQLLPVNVHLLPSLVSAQELTGTTAVVVDLLRASTTIVHALVAGAQGVVPCLSVEEATDMASPLGRQQVVLGGERSGTLIPGFDLDNSPLGYTPETVAGKWVVFTTTNGTRALHHCRTAETIVVGSFVNLTAIGTFSMGRQRPVNIVCAGTNGEVSDDDVICAGAIASRILTGDNSRFEIGNSTAGQAVELYQQHASSPQRLTAAVASSQGGANLVKLGFQADIERATTIDLFEMVPVYDPATNSIGPA